MTNEERIKADAEKKYPRVTAIAMANRTGYIAGATAEHDRVQVLVDALEQIANSPVPSNEREMASWIETARTLVTTSLEPWEGKEVGDENT